MTVTLGPHILLNETHLKFMFAVCGMNISELGIPCKNISYLKNILVSLEYLHPTQFCAIVAT